MTKILFVSPTGTLDNGAEISIVNLMKLLVKRGHTIINVVPGYSQSLTKYEQVCIENNIDVKYIDAIKWWWEDAPGEVFGTDIERANSYRQVTNEISHIIKNENIELVITNTVNIFMGAVAAACQEIPHYWLIHEFPQNEFLYYNEKIDFIEENSDIIFSVGGELQSELQNLFSNKKIHSFLPYSELIRTDLKKSNVNRIVNVGRVSPRKNQLELIKAFHLLNKPELELIFIGGSDEAYKRKCLLYIKENKLKNISFLGHIDNPWSEITDKDICVFSSAMETFGLVYVEAVLNGIPTILSDNLGHRTAYDLIHVGNMYTSGNVEQLKSIINEYLSHFEIKKNESMKAVESSISKYNMDNLYKEIVVKIENELVYSPKSIRHLKNLLILNDKKSKLAKIEHKVRLFLQKIVKKIRSII